MFRQRHDVVFLRPDLSVLHPGELRGGPAQGLGHLAAGETGILAESAQLRGESAPADGGADFARHSALLTNVIKWYPNRKVHNPHLPG
nr:hypothetical protein GCM10020093_082290 [Planobispora longispora]